MYRIAKWWLVCVVPAVVPGLLAAQTLGLPLSYRPVMSGFSAAVDAGGDKDGFRTIALTGIVALGHLTADSSRIALLNVSGTVARLAGAAGAAGGTGVGAEVSLLGSFAVGVDRSRWAGTTRVYVPIAAALPLVGCAGAKSFLFVYGVPVWNFERVDLPRGGGWQRSWGSVNLGTLLELPSGLGFEVGVGGLVQRPTPDPYRRVVVAAGVHFSPHGMMKGATDTKQGRWGCSIVL